MEQIKKKIQSKRSIKENTLNTYLKNLNRLALRVSGKELKTLSFLNEFKKVKDILEKMSVSTRKNYLASILVALQLDDNKNEEVLDKYREYLNDVSDAYYKDIKEQKKTAKQSKEWLGLADTKKVIKYYSSLIRKHKINTKSKKVLSKSEREILKAYLLVCLYLLDGKNHPPRRNVYSDIKIVRDIDYKKIPEKEKQSGNWLVMKSRNIKHFYLNDTKDKKDIVIKLSPAINSVVNLYLKYHDNREWLLYNSRGAKMNSNSLTKFLQKIFMKATGKKIGSTMLRHIFISDTLDLPKLKEQEDMAKKMGHSVDTQVKHYYKHK